MFRRSTILFFLLLRLVEAAGSLLPIRDADLVLVGDIVSGQAIDHGTSVSCNVSVLVDRVLKGDLQPGQSIALAWQFEPMPNEGPQITTKVARAHALFFLHKNEESGAYEVIRAGFYTLPMGGYFLPVPSGPLHGPFLHARNSSFDAKLASELGAALEAIAVKDGDALDVHYAPPPFGGSAPSPKAPREDVDQFQSLCLLFNGVNAQAAAEVVTYFAGSPFAHLQAIGLLGELKLKDASAIVALESNMDALGRTGQAFLYGGYASMLDIRDKPAEVNALGRMAIAESAWFGFDGMAVHTLARADGLVAVPYLRVMLDNPRPEIMLTALQGLCSALTRNGEPLEGLCPVWHPDGDPYRASSLGGSYSTPQGDEAERSDGIKTWLNSHHPELVRRPGTRPQRRRLPKRLP